MAVANVMKKNPTLARRFILHNNYTCESCNVTPMYQEIENYFRTGSGKGPLEFEMERQNELWNSSEVSRDYHMNNTVRMVYMCQTKDCHGSIIVNVNASADVTYEVDPYCEDECSYEVENVDIMGIESKAQYEIKKHAGTLETIPLTLCIIVKTKFNAGFCYLGFSHEDQCLIRPIYNTEIGNCCWGRGHELELGKWYKFQANAKQKDITALPHSNNDIVVANKYDEQRLTEDLFSLLCPFAKQSMRDIFMTDEKYVVPGTDCPSLGIIRTTRGSLKFVKKENKTRIIFQNHDMSYTSSELTGLDDVPEDENVLLLVGLARPWQASHWLGERCSMLGLGVICQQKPDLQNRTTAKPANPFQDVEKEERLKKAESLKRILLEKVRKEKELKEEEKKERLRVAEMKKKNYKEDQEKK